MVRSGLLIAVMCVSLAALAEDARSPAKDRGGKAATAGVMQRSEPGRQAAPKHRGSLSGKGLARRPSRPKSAK